MSEPAPPKKEEGKAHEYRGQPGKRLLNWFAYLDPPEPFTDPRMILPGTVDDRLLDLLDSVLDAEFPPL